jgi:hypothetical protein
LLETLWVDSSFIPLYHVQSSSPPPFGTKPC